MKILSVLSPHFFNIILIYDDSGDNTITPPLYHHTSTLNHSTSPQNRPSPLENHLTQNSFTPQQTHQNLFPMGNVTFFLQK
ncbi:hypothetical protein LguiA_012886 [Lonicera macranthoides]